MNKIGIMTWFQYNNYGTVLQATALSNTIREMGYDPEIINYNAKSAPISIKTTRLVAAAANKIFKRHTPALYANDERERAFYAFKEKNLNFSPKCDLLSDLQLLNSEYQGFVCGSDQIWAPSCFDSHYFLDFVFDNNRKIAYAPSIGLPTIEDEFIRERVRELAKTIPFLSTREECGSAIISSLCAREVKTVLDPTLLLSAKQWLSFSNNYSATEKGKYILVYMLGNNKHQWKTIYSIAKKLSLDVKIIPVFEQDLQRNGCILDAIGPAEFIAAVHDAAYVCTDSFHGLTFSVIFHKPFTVFERFKANDKLNQNSRIYNLLDKLSLRNRLCVNNASLQMLQATVNYEDVDQNLKAMIKDSKDYLCNALASATSSHLLLRKQNIHYNNSLCCGCGVCLAVCPSKAIQIKINEDGFFSSSVDDNRCISCGKCSSVCPFMKKQECPSISTSELYSLKSNSGEVLKKSSSGGAAFHISEVLLQSGYSVGGCIFDIASQTAKHIILNPSDAVSLSLFQGSKYLQSDFSDIARQLYDNSAPTVIFGTPCQIAGLRSLFPNRENLILIDLICHGVPSYHLYRKYQEYLKEKGFESNKLSITFRDKEYGWSTRYITVSDSSRKSSYKQDNDPFYLAFEHCLCYSHNCYECPWRDCSTADIRLGDYWGKRFEKDNTGISEVVVLTDKGKEVMAKLISLGECIITKQDIHDYISVQQITNGREPVFWKEFLRELSSPNTKMKSITKRFVLPFERRKRIKKAVYKFYHIIKGK